jgi:hypothetical protein
MEKLNAVDTLAAVCGAVACGSSAAALFNFM